MINNISNSITASSDSTINNQQSLSGDGQTITGLVSQAYNQPVEPERTMRGDTPSSSSVPGDRGNESSREVKRDDKWIYQKSIKEFLGSETKDGLFQALKDIEVEVEGCSFFIDFTAVRKKYHPDTSASSGWRGDILERCREEIVRNICDDKPSVTIDSEGNVWNDASSICVCLNFYDPNINMDTIDIVFKSFNKVFNEDTTSDRFLLASSAIKLRDRWLDNPPDDIDKNDIIECVSRYPELFTTGETATNYFSTENSGVSLVNK